MKFLIFLLLAVAFIAAFVYAAGLIFKDKPAKSTSLDELDKKAEAAAAQSEAVENTADEIANKAKEIKSKVTRKK